MDANRLMKKPELPRPQPPKKLFEEQSAPAPETGTSAAPAAASPSTGAAAGGVTIEYQRARAKEMVKYFKEKKLEEEVQKSRLFGWTPRNEIINARWVMFGVAVGMMTEYATGVDFPHQISLMLTYLGIVDTE